MVLSQLNNCNSLLSGLCIQKKLQKVQSNVDRITHKKLYYQYNSPVCTGNLFITEYNTRPLLCVCFSVLTIILALSTRSHKNTPFTVT